MRRRAYILSSTIAALATFSAACGTSAPPDGSANWTCPAEWVPAIVGGCGPAVLLCGPTGGAAAGACDRIDLTRSRPVGDSDGGRGGTFFREADGGIGGAWPGLGSVGGPPARGWLPDAGSGVPAANWAPDAGISSCPVGWPRLADGTCDPALRSDCPAGTGALPGGTCTATGATECWASEYADPGAEAIGAVVVHVRAGADAMTADGTAVRPFATLADGVSAAGTDGWVLVAAGSYIDTLTIARGVHILGRCAHDVSIRGRDVDASLRVAGTGVRVDVRGITFSGNGITVTSGASLAARTTRVLGVLGRAVVADGATTAVDLQDVWIDATRGESTTRPGGQAIYATGSSSVTASRTAISASAGAAVEAFGGSVAALSDCSIRQTTPTPGRSYGLGLFANGGGTVRATRVVTTNGTRFGASAFGGTLRLEDVIIRDTIAAASSASAYGLGAETRGQLIATRVLVDRSALVGLHIDGRSTTATVIDSVVRGTTASSANSLGRGINVQAGGRLDATGVLVSHNHQIGAGAFNTGSSMTLTDSVVRDTREAVLEPANAGVIASDNATVVARRVLVDSSTQYGIVAHQVGGRVRLEDSVVRGTRAPGADYDSWSVAALAGGTLAATRVLVVGNECHGFSAALPGSVLDAIDSVADGSRTGAKPHLGVGIVTLLGGTVRARGVRIENSRGFGVNAIGEGSGIELDGCIVRGSRPFEDRGHGAGASAVNGASLAVRRSTIVDNTDFGAGAAFTGSSLEVSDSVVIGTHTHVRGAGPGLAAVDGARLEAARVSIVDNQGASVYVSGAAAFASLVDSVVVGTRPTPANDGGRGLQLYFGATVVATRVAFVDQTDVGIIFQSGSRGVLRDVLVAQTRSVPATSLFGTGIEAEEGSIVDAARVAIQGAFETGIATHDPSTVLTLSDAIIRDVLPSGYGYGTGVLAMSGSHIDAARVAVDNVSGAAFAAVPGRNDGANPVGGSRLTAVDIFARGIHSSTIRLVPRATELIPSGRAVAYGVHVGQNCRVDATRMLVTDSGYGFVNSQGSLLLRSAVVARMLDAIGAVNGVRSAADQRVENLHARDNAHDEVVRDVDLPAGTALPTPSAVCFAATCM